MYGRLPIYLLSFLLTSCVAAPVVQVACYDGPAGTEAVGECRAGIRLCPQEGECKTRCSKQIKPSDEVCDGADNDCDGQVDEAVANVCGGCKPLVGRPGEPCGECGALFCSGEDKLTCAATASTVNKPCKADNGCPGTFVCDGSIVQCVTTLESDVCGGCSDAVRQQTLGEFCSDEPGCTGVLVCNPKGGGSMCLGGSRNACGVCGPAVLDLGSPCQAPNGCSGLRACDSTGQISECIPIVETNECGLCGAPPVVGIGESCSAPGGGAGRAVCNQMRDGLDCAHTVVTLSYDDTNADNVIAGQLMAERGLRGIFYINSTRLLLTRYLTLDDVRTLVALGNEIGGHTLNHIKLPTLTAARQQTEICNDRAALLGYGLPVRSFAYPFGLADDLTASIVSGCNYDSGRLVGSIPKGASESFIPGDRFRINAASSYESTNDFTDLQERVEGAETAGGWVFVNMHHICADCSTNGIDPELLGTFLDWLAPRAELGTLVRTPRDLLPGVPKPSVKIADPPSAMPKNGSFEEDIDADAVPDCWQHVGTSLDFPWANGIPRTGTKAVSVTVNASGDRRGIGSLRSQACEPALNSSDEFEIAAWYISPTAEVSITVSYQDNQSNWFQWKESDVFPTSTEYRRAIWRVKDLAPEAQAFAIEINAVSPGIVTIDDFTIRDLSEERGEND